MNKQIRVLVVDDSALMRRVITELIQQDPEIEVIGTANDGRAAIALTETLRPDLITMDVRMPVMDGLAATEYVMGYYPTPILVLTASLARHEVDITFKMLGAGALEVIEKPSGSDPRKLEVAGYELIRRIKVLARVKVVTHLRGRRKTNEHAVAAAKPVAVPTAPARQVAATQPTSVPVPHAPSDPTRFPLILIGASTGGPRAIHQILSHFPNNLPAAILIVQHIAEGFGPGMVEWLKTASRLPVRLATEGDPIIPGTVLLAPDAHNLLISRVGKITLSKGPLLVQQPAIDVAMQAAADTFGARTIGVLLTGMGRDGARGMCSIRRAGGHTIAQDEASCTIFGMPRAAIELNGAVEVLPTARIATRLIELVVPGNAVAQ